MTSSNGGEQRVPARIDLEEFIEAVTRGVQRAMEAQGDTSGFVAPLGGTQGPGSIINRPPIIIGLIYNPIGFPGSLGTVPVQTARVG